MLTHRGLPRGTLVLLMFALALFILTASKLNNGIVLRPESMIQDWLHGQNPEEHSVGNQKCKDPSLDFLRSLDLSLTETFTFSRRCVKPIITPNLQRASITNISGPFFTHETETSLSSCPSTVLPPCDTLPLSVPAPYPVQQYPHLLFGVASTYERIESSLPAFTHWLSDTSAHLIIVISDFSRLPPHLTLESLETQYRSHGIHATIIPPSIAHPLPRKTETAFQTSRRLSSPAPVEQLHFLLVSDLLQHATPRTQWLGILDDDTFFPSLYPLSESLSRYPHAEPLYLGAPSDNWNSLAAYGHQAFGGAGIFISLPLARALAPNLRSCAYESASTTGDSLLGDCVGSRTAAKLTVLPGLNQHDLHGDASGWFEGDPNPLLSIHHWKSWYRAPAVSMAGVAKVCGACLLRRYRFQGDDTVWVNGYSVSRYSEGVLDKLDLDKMEGTWEGAGDGEGGGYELGYGTLRERLGEEGDGSGSGRRKRWKLVDARIDEDIKKFRQIYVWKDSENEKKGRKGKDGVVEIIWDV
ncbi:glycosyltransferase [Cladorrhinum samala]|uniref:Glycosyltransferase n=1 Tax=Cladorrhinum samala TaxID=585594 RepID=A0AAV9HRC7_9PEZI|nr:glycosyltransferase [Cladorrhinum samala]